MHPIKHFITITRHRHKVIAHCAKAGILWQGLRHDLSKYMPVEFLVGAKYYQGDKSPNAVERMERGYSKAWLHHKGINRHHYEYWTDYSPVTKKIEPVKMPLRYVAEMFCDRVAASQIYCGDKYNDSRPLEYFAHAKSLHALHEDTEKLLEKLLVMLAEGGEKKTFAYLRQLNKNKKEY